MQSCETFDIKYIIEKGSTLDTNPVVRPWQERSNKLSFTMSVGKCSLWQEKVCMVLG